MKIQLSKVKVNQVYNFHIQHNGGSGSGSQYWYDVLGQVKEVNAEFIRIIPTANLKAGNKRSIKVMTLTEKVFDFECEISNEQALEFEVDIDKLKTLEDVKNYYLFERGWINDKSLVELLFDFIIDLK